MDRYNIKLTIVGLYGPYAEKYSHTVEDAQFLHTAVGGKGKEPLELFARHDQPQEYDPLPLFPTLMKQLRLAARERAERRFFTGVRFEPSDAEPTEWTTRIEGEDDQGPFWIEAVGRKAQLYRSEKDEPINLGGNDEVVHQVEGGVYRCRFDTWQSLFKDDLEKSINMCEESMAKGQNLVATAFSVDEDPPPPPEKGQAG